jgi:hypothetical protein
MDRYFFERLEKSEKLNQFIHHHLRQSKDDEENLFLIWDEKVRLAEGLYNAFDIFLKAFPHKKESRFSKNINDVHKTYCDFSYEDCFFFNEDYLIEILSEMLAGQYNPANLACFEIKSHLLAMRFFYMMMKFIKISTISVGNILIIDTALTNMASFISSLVIQLLYKGSKFDFDKNRNQKSSEKKQTKEETVRRNEVIEKAYYRIDRNGKSNNRILKEVREMHNLIIEREYHAPTQFHTSIDTVKRVLKEKKLPPFG